MGVSEPGEVVAGIVVFQNQLGMIMKQLKFSSKTRIKKLLQRVHISLSTE